VTSSQNAKKLKNLINSVLLGRMRMN